ncbi:signal peptidase I [Bifidobacterium aquikefiricola]|uniref:Signal peptidase I n=1 Tax=Bifidobacterium aquikefiricola TaxID=3059038 RepID=A0AB39U7U0_9BIFI
MHDSDDDEYVIAVADRGVDPDAQLRRGRTARHKAPPQGSDTESLFSMKTMLTVLVLPLVIVFVVRVFFLGLYSIPSASMMDTIQIGDRVITSKIAPKYPGLARGDIIVFKDPAHWLSAESSSTSFQNSEYLIKRLIGLPGDTVACKGSGWPVTVNGVAIDEKDYIRPGVDPSSMAFNVKVAAGHVFVLGDNRSNSADSRYHTQDGDHGLVPESDVVGVGIAVYWPISRWSVLSNYEKVFASVPQASSATE